MSVDPQSVRIDHESDDIAPEVRSDVAVVPQADGNAMVAFHLQDGSGSLSCMLTQEQAAALSNALILAADRARFLDASRPRRRNGAAPGNGAALGGRA
jgi:hypothetical protein